MKNKRLLLVLGTLYLSQGIPFGLAFEALPVVWRDAGFGLDILAFVPLAGLPWAFKFLWAPFVENHWISSLGRRKSWILPLQVMTAISLVAMVSLPVVPDEAFLLILLLSAASLFSATQDIAVDGLASERLPHSSLANVNAMQVGGIMTGVLIGGPGSIYLIGVVGYDLSLVVMAVVVVLCGVPLLFWPEPDVQQHEIISRAKIKHLFKRQGVSRIVILAFAVTLAGAVIFSLVKLILIDAGWSLEDVGILSGIGSSFMVLAGCILAAGLIKRIDVMGTIVVGLAAVLVAGIFWISITAEFIEISRLLVWIFIGVGGIGTGLVSVGSYTVLMRFARLGEQPATDFTFFQSSQIFGEILILSVVTGIAASFGYAAGIFLALLVGLFAMWFMVKFHRAISSITQV